MIRALSLVLCLSGPPLQEEPPSLGELLSSPAVEARLEDPESPLPLVFLVLAGGLVGFCIGVGAGGS